MDNFSSLPQLLERYFRNRNVRTAEHVLFVGFGLIALNTLLSEGFTGATRDLVKLIRKLPGVNYLIDAVLKGEVKGALKLLAGSSDSNGKASQMPIPERGVPPKELIKVMERICSGETTAEEGKAFAYTYTTHDMADLSRCLSESYRLFSEASGSGNEDHETMLKDVWTKFMHSNGLNPMMYPSLRRFENEIVSMAAWMLKGDGNVAGSLTSGGTESILMAVKTYRDRARKLRPHVTRPNMIAPQTVHPAFEKAAHYFDVEIIHVPVGPDYRVDVFAMEAAINRNTILLIGSAPQYCHGVVDPIERISSIALKKGLPLHVDACFGGFMLPWLEKIGVHIPPFDFRVAGVTSISADIHKYGYSSKGASVILYRNEELRSYQYFAYASWPGGLFGSPSMAGSRPGGMIAAAWAALVSMGQDGYIATARGVWATTQKIVEGVASIPGVKVITPPDMTCVALASDDRNINIFAVAEVMEKFGWKMERQQLPDTLHLSILPQHGKIVDTLLNDLRSAVEEVRANKDLASKGSTGVYGMVAAIPDKGIIDDFIVSFFSGLYSREAGPALLESFEK